MKFVRSFFRLPPPGLTDLFGILILLSFTFRTDSFFGDPGVGWHLRAGQWMLRTKEVVTQDIFLFTGEGKRWIHDQWLSDLFFAAMKEAGDFEFLRLVAVLACIYAFLFLQAPHVRNAAGHPLSSFFILVSACILGSVQWLFRPVVFSFLLFSLLYGTLYDRLFPIFSPERSSREAPATRDLGYFLVPLLFLLWTNLHPAFVLGLFLLASFTVARLVQRKPFSGKRNGILEAAGLSLCCLAITFINPWGADLHHQIFGLVSDSYFMKLNKEWLPPTHDPSVFAFFFICAGAFALLFVTGACRALSAFEILTSVSLLILSILHRRYIPFFAITWPIPFAKMVRYAFSESRTNRSMSGAVKKLSAAALSVDNSLRGASASLYTLSVAVLLALSLLTLGEIPFARTASFPGYLPKVPGEVLARSAVPYDRVFNHPDWGGFLAYQLYPRQILFIDDRNQFSGRKLYEDFFRMEGAEAGWEAIWQQHGFSWAIVRRGAKIAAELETRGWKKVSEDEKSILYERPMR